MYEEINDLALLGINLSAPLEITHGSKTKLNFQLASAVLVQVQEIDNPKKRVNNNINNNEPDKIKIIIGTEAFVSDRTYANDEKSCGIVYSPYNPICNVSVTNGKYTPITAVSKDISTDFVNISLAKRGTLFLYKKIDAVPCNVQLGTI
jgi:hypothetical protein